MSGIITTVDCSPLVQSKATPIRLTRAQCAAMADELAHMIEARPELVERAAREGIEPLQIQEAHRYLLQLAQG